jgi:hypothetical protein
VKVTLVEVKDVELPEVMRRAMARQAESERDRRAKVIHAEGEFEAAKRLAEAANLLARESGAMQLRLLQTLADITAEQNSTLIFPVPMELLRFAETLTAGLGDGRVDADQAPSPPAGAETGVSHPSSPGDPDTDEELPGPS